jgi:hypothetical protein
MKRRTRTLNKTNTENKIIAIDFDGVIHDFKNPIAGRRMGGVIEGAKKALETLEFRGYEIIVFSYWAKNESNIKTIADWMEYYHCPYSQITNIKPNAVAYIDDRGIRFTSWQDIIGKF